MCGSNLLSSGLHHFSTESCRPEIRSILTSAGEITHITWRLPQHSTTQQNASKEIYHTSLTDLWWWSLAVHIESIWHLGMYKIKTDLSYTFVSLQTPARTTVALHVSCKLISLPHVYCIIITPIMYLILWLYIMYLIVFLLVFVCMYHSDIKYMITPLVTHESVFILSKGSDCCIGPQGGALVQHIIYCKLLDRKFWKSSCIPGAESMVDQLTCFLLLVF